MVGRAAQDEKPIELSSASGASVSSAAATGLMPGVPLVVTTGADGPAVPEQPAVAGQQRLQADDHAGADGPAVLEQPPVPSRAPSPAPAPGPAPAPDAEANSEPANQAPLDAPHAMCGHTFVVLVPAGFLELVK
jgi:predicted lipid-binding transport protein (Tim44 family)